MGHGPRRLQARRERGELITALGLFSSKLCNEAAMALPLSPPNRPEMDLPRPRAACEKAMNMHHCELCSSVF